MKKIIYFMFTIFFMSQLCFAEEVVITAKEIGPEIGRKDFKFAYAASVKGQGKYEPKILYISKYQIISLKVENNSESILNVNPNYFTLVSNKKASYAYSVETHGFKDKIKFLSISPLQSVDVYPGTITEGFLLFEKKYENERPKKLFFKNIEKIIGVDVVLDKKVKQ